MVMNDSIRHGWAAALGAGCLQLWACGDGSSDRGEAGSTGSLDAGEAGAGEAGAGGADTGSSYPDADFVDSRAHDATVDAAPCVAPPGGDIDKDGFPAGSADCNDCDPNINPGAFDVAGNGVDEDCSNVADDEPLACDKGLSLSASEPLDGAKGIGLCRMQSGSSWGVIAARWVFPDGNGTAAPLPGCSPPRTTPNPLSRGLLPTFGTRIRARQGDSLLTLSSGAARSGSYDLTAADAPGSGLSPLGGRMCTISPAPVGFPKAAPFCPDAPDLTGQQVHNGSALELTIKVPSNAYALRYEFNFFATEFPEFVCNRSNDHFVALLDSRHPSLPSDKNISLDSQGNVVSVNSGLLNVCEPITVAGRTYACTQGPADLAGTGFDGTVYFQGKDRLQGGATGWLSTQAAVVPGETIKLRFAIWDADDPVLDATVLIDNFKWLLSEGAAPPPARPPETEPVLF